MASVFKAAGAKKYTILWTDEHGRRRKKAGYTDKGETMRLAVKLEERAEKIRDGSIDPRDGKFAEHGAKPIKEHLTDYSRAVKAKGATDKHVKGLLSRVQYVLDLAKIKRIADLSLSDVQEVIARIRQDQSTGTANTYVQGLKSFSRWLWRDKRAREHYLVDLASKDAKNDRRHVRRRMTAEEVMAVIEAAASGPDAGNLSGPDRAVLYHLAHGTGFRAKELRTLTPERFRLNVDPPTVTVLACYSKNGQEAIQPIAMALADRLRPWLALRPEGRPVFEGMSIRTADMLRVDLEAAGIPYETSDGVADFHASRGTYISNLVSSGASVKTCQTLARHANPALTIGIYAKASLHDISGAVENLPDLTPREPPEALAATGTEGATNFATIEADGDSDDTHNIFSVNDLRCGDDPGIIVRTPRCASRGGRLP